MTTYSFIIPHYKRERHLVHCLGSLKESAQIVGLPAESWEVIVVGEVSPEISLAAAGVPFRFVQANVFPMFLKLRNGEPAPFWKNKLLNEGIVKALGSVLVFLDADAVVGPRFMEPTNLTPPDGIVYNYYRVRKAPLNLFDGNNYAALFAHYDDKNSDGKDAYPINTEIRDEDDRMLGNSQISIRRSVLLDNRFDESYIGRSFEDLSMLRALRRTSLDYIQYVSDAAHAMFHIHHPLSKGFNADRWADRNRRRYHSERCLWTVSTDRHKLEGFKRFLCGDWVKYQPNRTIRCNLRADTDPNVFINELDEVLDLDADCKIIAAKEWIP